MTMLISVLGPVEARFDGRETDLGHVRQRSVLAALAAEANRTVPPAELIARVWGEDAPQRARATLHSYLSRLRQKVEDEHTRILRRSGGYVLEAEESAIDLLRFRVAVAEARRGPASHSAARLTEALGLWRGEPFAGIESPWFDGLREQLLAEQHAARLDLNDALLALGRHAEALPDLLAQVARQPFEERLVAQVMLALHRCGRSADALTQYETTRVTLAEELGIDPGPALRKLYHGILVGDPALGASAAVVAPVAAGTAPDVVPLPVPRQLPAAPAAFTGRNHELAALDDMLKAPSDGNPVLVISAIGGAGGIGKTWLALKWAHDHLDGFPDGQLYADLRGFDPSAEPVSAVTVISGFLTALGTTPEVTPADPAAQAALYRSLVANRRMLIVLDNARDADQVRPLLPGSVTCAVVVTSRHQMTGLATTHGARCLNLEPLPDQEAREVFTGALGQDRVTAEPEAVTSLLRQCAGLPLALGLVAARAAARPDFTLSLLAEELDDVSTRLDALSSGDLTTDVRAVFEASYHTLDDAAARLFDLLGLVAGPDVSLPAAASLVALPLARTRMLLQTMERVNLVQQRTQGRYRMHDLIRLYAAERGRLQPAATKDAALARVAAFYLHTAYAANQALDLECPRFPLMPPPAGCLPLAFRERGQAMAWCETEHDNLTATVKWAAAAGDHTTAWQLPTVLVPYFTMRKSWGDAVAANETALASARHLGHRPAQVWALLSLGFVEQQSQHRFDRAVTRFECALDISRTIDAPWEQSTALIALAEARRHLKRFDEACGALRECLELCRRFGFRRLEAWALKELGHSLQESERVEESVEHLQHSLAILREGHDRYSEAITLECLGQAHRMLGHFDQALACLRQALAICQADGYPWTEAQTMAALGQTLDSLGETDAARRAWQRQLSILEDLGHPHAERLRARLTAARPR
ncbi:AfsR/SARP family transcriptional regulator [Streptomyces roseolilacinus]|uniref:SARP family transcriptional regulator n=1 Tax=Streptomyces roseolilacinus TaxID=66904 RepID=A0A918AZM2_9ACTN|nr:BTAD domain-containing putative transcriptional regulator [Streptomyces roseolilacinus]GGP97529.1 SARP family transcriptional regulator [Streptomyces roseolilacinus]